MTRLSTPPLDQALAERLVNEQFQVIETGDCTTPRTARSPTSSPRPGAFAVRQVYWFRTADGVTAEHDAVRDDMAMAKQAGWIPPSSGLVLRMLAARRRERRAHRRIARLKSGVSTTPLGP